MADNPRIKIQPDGPYLVSGDLPLSEMAPVHTYNGEPVDWHRTEEAAVPRDVYALCRCGASAGKPFCDGTHAKIKFDGTETADRAPSAERQRTFEGDGVVMTDDESLCHHAGFCGTRSTNVWKLVKETSDPEVRERLKRMVELCPSGRLRYADPDGRDGEQPLPAEIAAIPGGPLYVRGPIPIEAADGREWETLNRRALCRCGASQNKPFCDGAHADAHFDER